MCRVICPFISFGPTVKPKIFVVIAIAAIVSALGSRGVSIALEAHLLTRIVVLLYIFSLPSSSSAFAFRRRLHRFRIFCFRSDRPIHVYFSINCRQRSFLSHRHWPGWDTAHSLTHTHAYGASSNHLLVVVNPPFVSIGFILSRSVGPSRFDRIRTTSNDLFLLPGPGRIGNSNLDIYCLSLPRAGPAIHIQTDP